MRSTSGLRTLFVTMQGGYCRQYLLASFLGSTPGCLGACMKVSIYFHGVITFGSVPPQRIDEYSPGPAKSLFCCHLWQSPLVTHPTKVSSKAPRLTLLNFIYKDSPLEQEPVIVSPLVQRHCQKVCVQDLFSREFP